MLDFQFDSQSLKIKFQIDTAFRLQIRKIMKISKDQYFHCSIAGKISSYAF